jgi:multidrug efflux pump subunit AcrA (membrane-fusion protein)
MHATIESASSSRLVPPALMVGMFVSVRIHATPDVRLLRIPESALQPGGTVWTVVEGRLREVSVRVAHATSDHVLVYGESTGLRPGDLVVVSPLAAPTEGATVTIRGTP